MRIPSGDERGVGRGEREEKRNRRAIDFGVRRDKFRFFGSLPSRKVRTVLLEGEFRIQW